jgi:PST family polysaccharide transporter
VLLDELKRKFESDLIKVLSLTAIANFIKIGINLVATKVVAVMIGPGGVALVGQFTNLINILTTTSTGGISNGIVKYVSEYKDDESVANKYISASFFVVLLCSVLSMFVLVFFARPVCIYLLGDVEYLSIIYITAFTIFLYAINTLLLSVINGRKLFRKYILINLFSSFASLVFTLLLVYYFKTYGALLALSTYQSVVIIITIRIIQKEKLFSIKQIWLGFSRTEWSNLFKYSLMAVTTLIWPVVNILIRSALISEISVSSAGVWEGMTRISGFVVAIMGAAITTYFLPRFSEIKVNSELKTELLAGLKIVLTVTFVTISSLFLFRSLIIRILFTEEFLSMRTLFFFQLTGDFFWVAKMMFTVILIARAETKKYIVLECGFAFLYFVLSYFFIFSGKGMQSIPLAHMIYNLVYFLLMIVLFKNLLKRQPETESV